MMDHETSSVDPLRPPGDREITAALREQHLTLIAGTIARERRLQRLVRIGVASMAVVTLVGAVGWRMSQRSAAVSVACQAGPDDALKWTSFDGADEASALAACHAYFSSGVERAVRFAEGVPGSRTICRDTGGRVYVLNFRMRCAELGYEQWAP